MLKPRVSDLLALGTTAIVLYLLICSIRVTIGGHTRNTCTAVNPGMPFGGEA